MQTSRRRLDASRAGEADLHMWENKSVGLGNEALQEQLKRIKEEEDGALAAHIPTLHTQSQLTPEPKKVLGTCFMCYIQVPRARRAARYRS